jgi:GrpB-like predicted nucleotidyltransferase (UPF0157 family)
MGDNNMSATAGSAGPEEISDASLKKVIIGELTPHNGPITIVDYDPEWPRLFSREDGRIRATLGDAVLLLEHVGSTSVPELAAKPIIDLLLVVRDSGAEASYVPALEAAGYILRVREPDWSEHRCLKGPDTAINLHVFSDGTAEIERMLRFRDRLRQDEADRHLYERTKRELAGRTWRHMQHYAQAKSAVVEEILARAAAGAH